MPSMRSRPAHKENAGQAAALRTRPHPASPTEWMSTRVPSEQTSLSRGFDSKPRSSSVSSPREESCAAATPDGHRPLVWSRSSLRHMTRRRVLAVGLGALALVAAGVAATGVLFGYRQGGPLAVSDAAGVVWRAQAGEAFTWAMPLPDNPTTSVIVVESIAPIGTSELEVVGVLASTQGCEVSSISLGYPPADVSTVDPAGASLPVSRGPCALQALVGVRRTTNERPGTIRGIRVRYRVGGVAYEAVLPWSLEVKNPGS